MHITWHGNYTIKIQTKDRVLVLDPHSPQTGIAAFRAKADLVCLSNPTDSMMSHVGGLQGEYTLLSTPGEYAISGFVLHALGWFSKQGQERSLQRWNIEGMVLVHVGALDRDLMQTELQELERTDIDILLLPVGGGGSLNVAQAMKLVTTIEPKVVIPIHFHLPGVKEKLDGVEKFAREIGVDPKRYEKKLVIRARNLPAEEMETVLLMP